MRKWRGKYKYIAVGVGIIGLMINYGDVAM